MKLNIRGRIVSLLTIALLIGLDRFTKRLAVIHLLDGERAISKNIIRIGETDILNLSYLENRGASFGILQGKRLFLILATGLLITGMLIFLLSDRAKGKALICSLTLIVAGGAGNLIDRVFQGYVVDFIDFRFINFPIFNVADICAVTGALLFVFAMIRDEIVNMKRKKLQKAEAADQTEPDGNEGD